MGAGSASAGASPAPAFAGFGPKALPFFRGLAFHQDKAWFEENRALYESDVKAPFAVLLADLSARFAAVGLPLRGDARSVFRLHRDIRFAKDKRPYKTNGGAVLTRDGTKRSPGLLYLHLDPDGCFMAAGFYQPEPEALAALRRAIARDPWGFLAAAEAGGCQLGEGDPVSRLPKGFEHVTEPDVGAAIRKRSWVVRKPIPDARIQEAGLADDVAAFGLAAAPLLRFGWDALGQPEPG